MRYVFNKIKNNRLRALFKTTMLFVLFLLLFISIGLNGTNNSIQDYLFKKIGINIILYGDINDYEYGGYEMDNKKYNQVRSILKEAVDYIEDNDLGIVNYEEGLHNTKILSAQDINNNNYYNIVLFNNSPTEDYLTTISKDVTSNKHYLNAIEQFYQEPNLRETISTNNESFYPVLVGVNDSFFSDLKLGYMNIISGRTFETEEIENGEMVAVVSSQAYILDRNGIKNVSIGDSIPINITYSDNEKVYEFKVIGIDDGKIDGLSMQDTYLFDESGYTQMYQEYYCHNIYIPLKCFEQIRNDLLDMYETSDIKPSKEIYFENDELVFYGQYGGVRPIVITVDNLDDYFDVTSYIKTINKKLNDISDRVIEYTYITNVDNLAVVLSSLDANKGLFFIASIASIIASIVLFIAFVLNDIESHKKDIAICITLGSNKLKMIFSAFVEYLILGLIPCVIAYLLSNAVLNKYMSNLNSKLIDLSDNLVYTNYVTSINLDVPLYMRLVPIIVMVLSLIVACGIGYIKLSKMCVHKILIDGE